jgi:hypothetical protein
MRFLQRLGRQSASAFSSPAPNNTPIELHTVSIHNLEVGLVQSLAAGQLLRDIAAKGTYHSELFRVERFKINLALAVFLNRGHQIQ